MAALDRDSIKMLQFVSDSQKTSSDIFGKGKPTYEENIGKIHRLIEKGYVQRSGGKGWDEAFSITENGRSILLQIEEEEIQKRIDWKKQKLHDLLLVILSVLLAVMVERLIPR
jgi:hypothetical protein